MKYQFELIIGNIAQIKTLYDLLLNRRHSISHFKMPSFKEHQRFVLNNPYMAWYFIKSESKYIGTFYLKSDNSIGLNLIYANEKLVTECLNFIKTNFTPQTAEPSVIADYFYVNVSTSNKELLKILKTLNLRSIQTSFKL